MSSGVAKRVWIGLQILVAAAMVGYAVTTLAREWEGAAAQLRNLRPDSWSVIAASALVLLAYAILIQTWRLMLSAWSAWLSYSDAARIWFVSNLGRYIPGKIWQIGVMSAMAHRRGVSPVAATGSSLVVNLASIVAGLALVLLTGAAVLRFVVEGGGGLAEVASGTEVGVMLLAIVALGLFTLPYVLPRLAGALTAVTGREVRLPTAPARAIWLAVAGTSVAWLLYGAAFAIFSRGLFASGSDLSASGVFAYVAVYTTSYLVGYLALFAPGGIGVRESVLVVAMPALGLASAPQALVIALASRVWLTVLEIAPGLSYLALGAVPRFSDRHDDDPK